MHYTFRVTSILCFLFLIHAAFSQSNATLGKKFYNNWSVTVGGGVNIFYGDLKEYRFVPALTPVNEIRFAGTFSLNRQLSHVFMLRGQVLYGEIAGEKTKYKDGSACNQYFEGTILEGNINGTINFSNLFGGYKAKRFFFVYGTLGAGLSNWYSVVRDINTKQQIGESGTPGSWTTEIVIPAGLGAYFSIKNRLNLGLEYTLRGVNSDKLDATVGGFPYDTYNLLAFNMTFNFDKPQSDKLTSASYQKQIGPPPPAAELAAMIAEEKKKEEAARAAQKAAAAKAAQDTVQQPKLLTPDTLPPTPEFTLDLEQDSLPSGVTPKIKGTTYRVQVFAYKEDTYSTTQVQEKFKLRQTVSKEYSGGWYRYTVGSFRDINDARKMMNEFKSSHSIPDAFIARYVDGKRASPAPPRTAKSKKTYKGKIYYSKPKKKK